MTIRLNLDPWWAWDGTDAGEMPPIALDVHVDSQLRRVTPFGELDGVSSPLLVKAVAMLARVCPGDSTLDLAHVTFIDAGGLGNLVRLYAEVVAHGGRLSVVGSTPRVRLIFEIAGLSRMLQSA
jgi:anti-anti-sigma factor